MATRVVKRPFLHPSYPKKATFLSTEKSQDIKQENRVPYRKNLSMLLSRAFPSSPASFLYLTSSLIRRIMTNGMLMTR